MIPPDSVPTTPPTRKRKPGRKPLHEHHSVDDKSLYFVLRNSKAPMAVSYIIKYSLPQK